MFGPTVFKPQNGGLKHFEDYHYISHKSIIGEAASIDESYPMLDSRKTSSGSSPLTLIIFIMKMKPNPTTSCYLLRNLLLRMTSAS